MNENFYDMLMKKCPSADILLHANYQKADITEYFTTVKAESIVVIRKK